MDLTSGPFQPGGSATALVEAAKPGSERRCALTRQDDEPRPKDCLPLGQKIEAVVTRGFRSTGQLEKGIGADRSTTERLLLSIGARKAEGAEEWTLNPL